MLNILKVTLKISMSLSFLAVGLCFFQAEPASLIVFGVPLLMLGTSAYVV